MSLVALKCSNCGGDIELDDSKDSGFCMHCGTKLIVQDEIQRIEISGKVKIDNSETYENCLNLANDAYISNNYLEAYNYYTKVLEIKNDDYKAIYRKALCAGYLSNSQSPRTEEIVNGFKKAFGILGNDTETASDITAELLVFATKFFPANRIRNIGYTFEDAIDCENYTLSLVTAIILLSRINPLIPTQSETHKKNLLSHLILLCDGITKNNLFRYKDGVQYDKKGKATPKYSTYNINANTRNNVVAIRKSAVDSFNSLSSIQEGIKTIQTDIDKYNNDIAKHKERVNEVWQANPEAHKKYKTTSVLLLVFGILCCVTILLIPIGVILFIIRNNKLKAMRNSVFSAELLEEIDKTKEIANKLRFKKQELAKYKSSNLKK